MSQELHWLTLTVLMTALFWVVYVLNRFVEIGVVPTMMNEGPLTPAKAAWAARAKMAHTNAVENLVIFAPLVILVQITNSGTALTASVTMAYFFARLVHFVTYSAGVPVVRTLAFLAGFACQVVLALTLLKIV